MHCMTIIKKVEEITVFESPDGGKTIYTRKSGDPERQMIFQDPKIHWKARWYEWSDILQAANDNPTLDDAIKKVEMIYELIRDRK